MKTSISKDMSLAEECIDDTVSELFRQRDLYGVQRHEHNAWLPILTEELGEVAEALQTHTPAAKETDASDLYKELIQVAAVAVSWAAQLREERE